MADFLLVETATHDIVKQALGYDPRDPEHLPREGLDWYEWIQVTDDQSTPGHGTVTLAPERAFDDGARTVTDTTLIRDETTQEADDRKFTEVDQEMRGVATLSFWDVHNALIMLIDATYQLARVGTPTLTKAQFQTALFNFANGANGFTPGEGKSLIEAFKGQSAGVPLQGTKNYLKALKDV